MRLVKWLAVILGLAVAGGWFGAARLIEKGAAAMLEDLRARGTTVIGATSKRAALAQADRVVVLVDGRVAEVGPWSALEQRWAHLAG